MVPPMGQDSLGCPEDQCPARVFRFKLFVKEMLKRALWDRETAAELWWFGHQIGTDLWQPNRVFVAREAQRCLAIVCLCVKTVDLIDATKLGMQHHL